MKKVLLNWFMYIFCLILSNCSYMLQEPRHMSLRWENYSRGHGDPEHAEWYFDDEYIGNGQKAFEEILTRIQNQNPGSILFIETEPIKSTASSFAFPHPPFLESFDEFMDILIEKKMIVKRQGFTDTFQGTPSEREKLETILWGVVHIEISPESIPQGYTPFKDMRW